MKIHTVRIRNFRCFGQDSQEEWGLIFRPNPYLNLIIGPNGAGKSALLDAIDIVMNADGRSNQALVTEYDFPQCDTSKSLCIEVTLTELGQALKEFDSDVQWIDPVDGVCVESKGADLDASKHVRAIIVRFEAQLLPTTGEIEWGWYLPKFPKTEMENAKELSRNQQSSLGYFRIHPAVSAGAFSLGQYSALGRHLRKLQYRMGKLPDHLRPRPLLPECQLENLQCENCPSKSDCLPLAEEDSIPTSTTDKGTTIGSVLNQIVSGAKQILGPRGLNDLGPALGPRFGSLMSALMALTIGLRSKTGPGKGFIPFERLSSGQKYALSFALAKSQVPGDLPPVITMEEPETALYPLAVAALIQSVQSSPATEAPQLIMSTHSESVLRCFAPDHIFVLGAAPTRLQTVVDQLEPSGGPFYKPEYLVMPGGPAALFADKVIIVEGAGEAVVSGRLDRLAAKLAATNRKPQMSFASQGWCPLHACGARETLVTVKVLTALGKRPVALFDGDGEGKEGADNTKDLCPSFIYRSDIEPNPTLEDALLIGLPAQEKEKVLEEFYSLPECQSCKRKSNKCWTKKGKENCPLGDRDARKTYLQSLCLSAYEKGSLYPPAFANLLQQIDIAQPGRIHQLNIS